MARPKKPRKLTPAQWQTVQDNLPLVYEVVNTMKRSPRYRRQIDRLGGFEDAVSAGTVAMAHAVRGFRPEKGFRFSTYAWKCVFRHVLEQGQCGGVIRTARHAHDRDVDAEVAEARDRAGFCRSLTAFQACEKGEREFNPPELARWPEEPPDYYERDALHSALARLPPRLGFAVRRYYLDGLKMDKIGAELGIGKEAVRQGLAKALVMLKEAMTNGRRS
jgi:RNA polymerase sigma factor (sigma-70 family)